MRTIKDLLSLGCKQLQPYSDSPRLDAELLLSYCINKNKTFFFSHPESEITEAQYQKFATLLNERSKGTPIAYLIGKKDFWSLTLEVTPDVLIPRADTELLVEQALLLLEQTPNPVIFDLGTGSGAIALALATERPDATIYASDSSEKALQIAHKNAKHYQLDNIVFLHSNWFEAYPKISANMIISNPPYISSNCPHIEKNVKDFEPSAALFSGNDGYQDLLTIIEQCKYYLCRLGDLLLEHGIGQEVILKNALKNHGFSQIKCHKDIQAINRCISAKIDPKKY